jgi:coatomer subunit beta'
VVPKDVLWNEAGTLVCLVCDETSYVLRYDDNAVSVALQAGNIPEDGIEGAFDFAHEIGDKVSTGQWVGDCLIFTNSANRLNYFVGGEVITMAHLDHTMYMLGYLPKEDRVFLVDNARNVVSFRILTSVLQFQTAVVRGDMNEANELIKHVPESEHSTVARFLESQGLKDEALAITKDPDQKFELALELEKLEILVSLMDQVKEQDKDTTDTISKWKRLGDLALSKGDMKLATKCAQASGDMAGILLLATSIGDAEAMTSLATQAKELGKTNVSFIAMFLLGNVEGCVDLLVDTGRIPEAAFMARTYMPSLMSKLVTVWKEDLSKVSTRAAQSLADPGDFPNLFPDLDVAMQVEAYFTANRGALPPAASYPQASQELNLDLISLFKEKSKAMAQQAEAKRAKEEAEAVAKQKEEATEAPAPVSPVAATPPAPPSVNEEEEKAKAAEEEAKIKKEKDEAAAKAEAEAKAAEDARLKAEAEAAQKRAKELAEAKAKAEEEAAAAKKKAEEEAAAAAKKKAEEEAAAAKKKAEEEAAAKRKAEEVEAARKAAEDADILGDDDIGDDW